LLELCSAEGLRQATVSGCGRIATNAEKLKNLVLGCKTSLTERLLKVDLLLIHPFLRSLCVSSGLRLSIRRALSCA
jgi:hypothetical protein